MKENRKFNKIQLNLSDTNSDLKIKSHSHPLYQFYEENNRTNTKKMHHCSDIRKKKNSTEILIGHANGLIYSQNRSYKGKIVFISNNTIGPNSTPEIKCLQNSSKCFVLKMAIRSILNQDTQYEKWKMEISFYSKL